MINPPKKERLVVRVDGQRKQQAAELANSMGTDLSNLINMFLAQLVEDNALPFTPTAHKPISDLDKALEEVKNGEVTMHSAEDFFKHFDEIAGTKDD